MKKNKFRGIFIGLIFIGIAVYIVLDVMKITAGIELWSVLLTLLAVVIFIKSIKPLNFMGIFFPLALAGILFDAEFGIEAFTPWPILGIALFLTIGCSILFNRKINFHNHKYYGNRKNSDSNYNDNSNGMNNHGENEQGYSEEKFEGDRIWKMEMGFGKKIAYVTSHNLREANIECGFAELQVYFTEAKMEGDSIQVNAEVGMGKAVIYFPKEWNVISKTSEVCGSVNEQQHTVEEGAPIVYLNVGIGFGKVEIKYI